MGVGCCAAAVNTEAMVTVEAELEQVAALKATHVRSKADAPLPGSVRWFWGLSIAAAVLTVLVACIERRAGMPHERWYPLQTPNFMDLLEYVPTLKLVHTAEFFHPAHASVFAYPPFCAALFAALYGTGHPVMVYVAIAVAALGIAISCTARALERRGLSRATAWLLPVTLALVSFPLWRLVPQGNIELLLWMFAAGGVWCFVNGREKEAAVLWGLAAAMKMYPVLLLLLFIPRGRWRAMLLGAATAVAATVLSLWWMGPTFAAALRGELGGVFGYQGVRAGQWNMNILATNHSAFTLVKTVSVIAGHAFSTNVYYAVSGSIFLLLFFARLRRMPLVNQLLGITIAMVLIPSVSYFHTLTHLYAPFVLLLLVALEAQHGGRRVPGMTGAMLLFLPLFSSFTLFTFRTVYLFGGIVQAIALGMLLLYTLQYPFATDEETAGAAI